MTTQEESGDLPNNRELTYQFLGRRATPSNDNGNGNGMRVQVQCHAGRKADERPIRFQLGERHFMVEEILDQWYGPDDEFFKVRADDGNLYILRHHRLEDEWSLESFRQTAK